MKRTVLLLGLSVCAAAALVSCASRSISDSGYHGSGYGAHGSQGGRSSPDLRYRGELTEWDVLGSSTNSVAPAPHEPVGIKRGDRVLVIQSGAFFPDDEMLKELDPRVGVAMFSGQPPKNPDSHLSDRLRAAARNGGCSRILVYWGVLESARENAATRTVSWVPIVGAFVPDSKQIMRIRVKAFVVDAETGHWSMALADSFEDQRTSAMVVRERSDQGQVARLKALAYRNLVAKLI